MARVAVSLRINAALFPAALASLLGCQLSLAQTAAPDQWYLDAINLPNNPVPVRNGEPLVIAIVDDGMRITHEAIREFIWTNPKEKPANGIDDDGNGYVDDIHGWDISDRDPVVVPPDERPDFYHGTHIASIVTSMFKAAYGDTAQQVLRIMPVKAIADGARDTYIKDGYEGIEYAAANGADIVIASWGVGHIAGDEAAILQRVANLGVLVVAATGNLSEEREQFPAAHSSVIAVGSIEADGTKTEKSNYGQFVDMSAPGTGIPGAGTQSDDSYDVRDGTSFSTAMVAAAAAMTKLQHPDYSNKQIEACLKSASVPIAAPSFEYSGKLGAGALHVSDAINCRVLLDESPEISELSHDKGFLVAKRRRGDTLSWSIKPAREIKGVRFQPVSNGDQRAEGTVVFRAGDDVDAEVVASYDVETLPESVFVPGNSAYVSFEPRRKRRRMDWMLEYGAETIDFSSLYCSGTKELRIEGMITDGSGPNDYSAKSSCKWLITAPPGKVIRFEFDEINTEPRVDLIHFFDGAATNESLMAMFSGDELPPVLDTWRNQVLVWFVSDGQNQGGGWNARYTFVDQK